MIVLPIHSVRIALYQCMLLKLEQLQIGPGGGGGVFPYISYIGMCRLVWFHDLRTSYVICVACLFRLIPLRTSYVTCVACLFRLIPLRTSYVTCVSCLFRLMVLRTSDVTCVVASLDLGVFRLVVLRTSYVTCVARLAHKSSSKSAKRDRAPCLEARSAIVRARASERVEKV